MIKLFLDWLGEYSLSVPDDIVFLFAAVSSVFILVFLLDFLRFIMYYITRR